MRGGTGVNTDISTYAYKDIATYTKKCFFKCPVMLYLGFSTVLKTRRGRPR